MALNPIKPQSVNRIAILVLGQAGVGKTSLLRSLCGQGFDVQTRTWQQYQGVQPEKTLVLSAEGGLLCVRDLVSSGRIEGFEIHSLDEFKEAQALITSAEFLKRNYRWIFIDSLTEIASACAEVMSTKYKKGYVVWDEYNKEMTAIIKTFRDMTMYNVVFTCLVRYENIENAGSVMVPDIPGSMLKQRLPSFFDEVFYVEKRVVNGKIQVYFGTAFPPSLAKDRSGFLDNYEPANLLLIQQKILGEKNA